MRNKKAISILKKQLLKVENPEKRTDLFLMETRTYIEFFFSETSEQYNFINHFKWYKPSLIFTLINEDEDEEANKKYNSIKEFIENSIDTIENLGIKKEPVDNWFSKLPNWAFTLGLPALSTFCFTCGILFTNNNNSELRTENKKLKDVVLLISSDTVNNNHKNMSKILKK